MFDDEAENDGGGGGDDVGAGVGPAADQGGVVLWKSSTMFRHCRPTTDAALMLSLVSPVLSFVRYPGNTRNRRAQNEPRPKVGLL